MLALYGYCLVVWPNETSVTLFMILPVLRIYLVSQYNEIINEIPSILMIHNYNAKLWKMSIVVLFFQTKTRGRKIQRTRKR